MSHLLEEHWQEEAVRSVISYWREKHVAMYGPPLAEWFPLLLEEGRYSYLIRYPDAGYNAIATFREHTWQVTQLEEVPLPKIRAYFLAKTPDLPEHERQSYKAGIKTMHEDQLRNLLDEGWHHTPNRRD